MPQFDIIIMPARFPGIALDGTKVRRGDLIAFDTRKRKVITSDPRSIETIQCGQEADAHDMRAEDEMRDRCGL
jgi:hypothetical protein